MYIEITHEPNPTKITPKYARIKVLLEPFFKIFKTPNRDVKTRVFLVDKSTLSLLIQTRLPNPRFVIVLKNSAKYGETV
jgi:hypothetical protein